MLALFLFSLVLGGSVLLLQLVLGAGGLSHDAPDGAHGGFGHAHHGGHEHASGLHLFSVRTLAAAVAFFGGAGWVSLRAGLPGAVALVVAAVVGAGALVGTAFLMRSMLRFEYDGTARIEGAVGLPARVYLAVPGNRRGLGKVQLTLQNRTVEYQAVSAHDDLPTGADVIVVDVVGPDTVEVVPTPTLPGEVDV